MVMNTVHPRLFPEQRAWILNDDEHAILFIDLTCVLLVRALRAQCKHLTQVVLMTDCAHMPAEAAEMLCFEELVEAQTDAFEWPELDENSACGLCYTSGTTGNPKGALFSHRSTVLHAYGTCMPDAMCLSSRDCVLPVVPMFHANAWGLPFSAPMIGAKIVFPGAALDGKSLFELFENERVTFSAGVPTVWNGLIQYMRQNKLKPTTLRRTIIGGAACPPAMLRALEDEFGIEASHAWGMTELSPLGCVCKLREKHMKLTAEQRRSLLEKQGHVIYGVDWKIVDGSGAELPWDGEAFGDLMVRGPWVVSGYYKLDKSPLVDGWLPTGDVATIDADGDLKITDRSNDVIKSGGERIGSAAPQRPAMAHPAVHAAVGNLIRHPTHAAPP